MFLKKGIKSKENLNLVVLLMFMLLKIYSKKTGLSLSKLWIQNRNFMPKSNLKCMKRLSKINSLLDLSKYFLSFIFSILIMGFKMENILLLWNFLIKIWISL